MEQTKCEFDMNVQKLIGGCDEIVDCSYRIPVKRVQMWVKSAGSEHSLYGWMSTVRNVDSLAAVLMDLSLYGWMVDCVNINPDDCSEVEIYLSRWDGKYNTNITPEVVEKLMGLTWVN